MKKLLSTGLILVVILSFQLLTAQENRNVKDPKAKAILDKLSATNKGYSSISADFIYKLENKADGIDEEQSGSILFAGEKYKLIISGQEIISNGETMWTYIADADEVQISEVPEESDDEMFMNPSKLFTIYESGFKYVYDKSETIDGKVVDVIKLYPENPDERSFHTIVINVLHEKNQIHSMVIKSKDGNIFSYELKKFSPNVSTNSATFEFDESKAGDVIDLR